jgi:gliding motility-associated-like protein
VPAALTFNGIILNPDTSSLTWYWNFGNGNTSNLQNPAMQAFNTAGNFSLQLIVSTLNGCSDTVNKTILIHPLPTTDAGNYTNVCVNAPLQLLATGANSYVWSPSTYLNCTACDNPVSIPADTVTYYVTGTSIYGCQTTDSVFLNVHKKFILTVTPTTDSLCTGQSIQLTAAGAENYIWSPAIGLSNNQVNDPLATPDSSTVYQVIGYDNAHCFKDTSTVDITVFPYPTVVAGPGINIPDGGSVTLNPQYSANVVTWMWGPSTGLSCTDCASPIASPDISTIYTITVANSLGCTASDMVRVNLPCLGTIFIPNTFSPNNDGVNDVFYPRGKNLYLIQSMRIFDRWGEMIFQRQNFTPNDATQGWDGTYNGQKLNPDVYVYIIEILCDNSTLSTYKGNVALIR